MNTESLFVPAKTPRLDVVYDANCALWALVKITGSHVRISDRKWTPETSPGVKCLPVEGEFVEVVPAMEKLAYIERCAAEQVLGLLPVLNAGVVSAA